MAGGDAETVTVIRPPAKGKFGDRAPGAAVEFELPGVMVAPGASTELVNGQNSVDTDMTLYAEGNSDTGVRATDRIRVRGQLYEVVGQPAVWGRFGTVIQLRRFAG